MPFTYLTLLAGILVSVACAAKPTSAPIQVYEGSGRACAGKLTITPKNISWLTPFSQCPSAEYELVKNEKNIQVYRFKKMTKKCLYEYIQLETHLANDQTQAVGFQNQQDFAKQDTLNALSCMIFKDDTLSK